MAREKTKDLISQMIPTTDNQRTDDAQQTDKRLTDDSQTTDNQRTDNAQKGETPRRQIRIPDTDWNRLTVEATERGISTSALVRQILREWLRKG